MADVEVTVSAEETVSETTTQMANNVERAVADTEQAFDTAARGANRFGEAMDMASGAGSQLSGGIGDIGGSLVAFGDLQKMGEQRTRDHQMAMLAAEQAQKDYDEAVKEFGKDSLEARTAQAALNQAQADAKPPTEMQKWGETLELLSPIIMAAVGAADLLLLANTALSASWVKNTAAMVAHKTAQIASSVATGIATAAQWLWNAAFAASGIGLIILAVAALVAGIIYLATQTQFFQKLWEVVWNAVKVAFKAVLDFVKSYYEFVFNALKAALNAIKDFFIGAFKFAIDFVVNYFNFIYSIPGKVVDVFKAIGEGIFAPFRWAFNMIAHAWNNTVGRLSFTIPDWVPGLGGSGFSMPNLPTLQTGGDILRTGMVLAHKGERIVPAATAGLGAGGGGSKELIVRFVFEGADEEFRRWFQKTTRAIAGNGSDNVQIAWGGSSG